MNRNIVTKTDYKGGNQDVLEQVRKDNGYQSEEWVTFYQAKFLLKRKLVNATGKGIRLRTFQKVDPLAINSETVVKSFVVFNCDLLEKGGDTL